MFYIVIWFYGTEVKNEALLNFAAQFWVQGRCKGPGWGRGQEAGSEGGEESYGGQEEDGSSKSTSRLRLRRSESWMTSHSFGQGGAERCPCPLCLALGRIGESILSPERSGAFRAFWLQRVRVFSAEVLDAAALDLGVPSAPAAAPPARELAPSGAATAEGSETRAPEGVGVEARREEGRRKKRSPSARSPGERSPEKRERKHKDHRHRSREKKERKDKKPK